VNKYKKSSNNTVPIVLYLSVIFLSALLLAVSFPPFNFWPAAYFFLVPILVFVRKFKMNNWRSVFIVSFLSGLFGYGIILYWVFPTVLKYTGSVLQSVVSLFLISAYPSLYLGVWGVAAGFCFTIGDDKQRKSHTLASVLFLVVLWVAFEYIRSFLFTGFPWAIIGYSQWNFRPALWVAAYGGVFAVSFMVVLGNLIFCKGFNSSSDRALLLIFSLWLIIGCLFTVVKHKKVENSEGELRVTVIQPSVEQDEKWDERFYEKIKERISQIVVKSSRLENETSVILWPETSLTEIVSSATNTLPSWIELLVKKSGSYHIIGSLYGDIHNDVYNTAIFALPSGELKYIHKKTHLVPFGEFVPFRRYLAPFFGIFNEMGDLQKGTEYTVMELDNKKFSVVICSENLFGDITRKFVKNGAGFLAVITNDAWYDRTPAAFQHFTFNVLRAVENSRWIIQSANTGVSGVISDDGRVIYATGLFEVIHFDYNIPVKRNLTFYTRYGDLFAIMCLVISVGEMIGVYFFNKYSIKGNHQ